MEHLTWAGKHLDSMGLAAIIVLFAVVAAWRAVRGFREFSTEERERYKQTIAVALLFPTGGALAAAVLFLYGGMVNAIKGNFGEFRNMMAIGVPLAILGAALWWVMFRWPKWPRQSTKHQ